MSIVYSRIIPLVTASIWTWCARCGVRTDHHYQRDTESGRVFACGCGCEIEYRRSEK